MYYVYILRCQDESLYTGITTEIERRMREHFGIDKRAANYTRWHTAKRLEAVWQCETRQQASRLEYRAKRLSKAQKEALLVRDNLAELLGPWLNVEEYTRVDLSRHEEFLAEE